MVNTMLSTERPLELEWNTIIIILHWEISDSVFNKYDLVQLLFSIKPIA